MTKTTRPLKERTLTPVGNESRTKQQFKDECDIGNILRKTAVSGVIEHANTAKATYQDVSQAVDYKTGVDAIHSAEEAFMALPSPIRKEFNNDPGEFLDAAHDPKQRDRFVDLGLAPKPPKKEAEKVSSPDKIKEEPELPLATKASDK